MKDHTYPTSLAEIETWARAHKIPAHQARVRFMEFVILDCLAQSRYLRNSIVFKGGNDLDLYKIADFLIKKSSIRPDIDVRKSHFNSRVRDLAQAGTAYDKMIADQASDNPIDFDVAWHEVITLVKSLDIPD